MKETIEDPEEIIRNVTESPGVFAFGDILDNPKIKAIDNVNQSKLIALLKLFCFGDYTVYMSAVDAYPTLTPLQHRKLRQLTIISACNSKRQIPYSLLLAKLNLSSLRELEDLIIELFYLEAICGRLDQQRGLLVCESSIGRDLLPHDLQNLQMSLDLWSRRVNHILEDVAKDVSKATKYKKEWDFLRTYAVNSNKLKGVDRSVMDIDSTKMDVDDWMANREMSFDGESGFLATGDKGSRFRKNPLRVFKPPRI